MNYEELTKEEQKKLLSIEKRMKSIHKELKELDMHVYFANDTANIMRGDTHDNKMGNALQENVMHDFLLSGWGGGDW